MQIERRDIEAGLLAKGFVQHDSGHRYFYHEFNGKRTGAYTYTSYGSSHKIYGDNLIQMMKRQLRLDSVRMVIDLIRCPLSGADYNEILRRKGAIRSD